MSEQDEREWVELVPVAEYGRWRREQHFARMQANSEMAQAVAMEAHQADHDVITRSTHGTFGAMTPQEQAAAVAARPVTVGTEWSDGRPLERHGGLYDHNLGPAPARRDLRFVGQPGQQPPGESPVVKYMRERN